MAKEEKDKSKPQISVSDELMAEALDCVNKNKAEEEDEKEPENKQDVKQDDKQQVDYDRYVRLNADYDNFRKRYQREKLDWQKYGAASFLRAFLPVVDNLERAVNQSRGSATATATAEALQQGLEMILVEMARVFKEQGLQVVDPQGEVFDPLVHEAVETKQVEGLAANQVVEVHQKGCKLWDRLIRPARVTVSTTPAEQKNTT